MGTNKRVEILARTRNQQRGNRASYGLTKVIILASQPAKLPCSSCSWTSRSIAQHMIVKNRENVHKVSDFQRRLANCFNKDFGSNCWSFSGRKFRSRIVSFGPQEFGRTDVITTRKHTNIVIPALFVSMRSWRLKTFVLSKFGLLRKPAAQRLQTKAAKNSSQNTRLLPHNSEVIDVSFLHFWVLYDFANFNSNCSFDVILSRFHALSFEICHV